MKTRRGVVSVATLAALICCLPLPAQAFRTPFGDQVAAAIDRARAYLAAGADVLFVEALESEAEFAAVAAAIDAPLLANMVEGGRSPVLPAATLRAMGYAIAIYPGTGFLAAAAALQSAYQQLRDTGSSAGLSTPLYALSDMHTLMGFDAVWQFDQQWQD